MAIIFPDPSLQTPLNTFSPTSTPDSTTNGLTYTWNGALGVWTSSAGGGGVSAATLAEAAAGTINTKYLSPETGVPKNAAGMTGAAIIPGGDDTERAAITSPVEGMLRYNNTALPAVMEYYDGSNWVTLSSGVIDSLGWFGHMFIPQI
jgi:hypothetical protein